MTVFSLSFDGPIAQIDLDRSAARNAISIADWRALADLCGQISASDARVVLVRSAVPGIFSAGADIGEFPGFRDQPAQRVAFREAMASGIEAIAALPIPVIASVDGGCFGAAVALTLACDICVAGERAQFATTPARLGLSYPGQDVARLIARVGKGFASLMLFSGERIDADRALSAGLADMHVDHAEEAARVLCATIAANDPGAVSALKQVVKRPAAAGHADAFDERFGSAEFNRRMTAFLEGKRR